MSLWYESLGQCLYDCGDDIEQRARCILRYLSMDVPRFWWERALKIGKIDESHAMVLYDLHDELQKVPELAGKVQLDLLVALAFIDQHGEAKPEDYSRPPERSISEYMAKLSEILIKRPELARLGDAIKNRLLQL